MCKDLIGKKVEDALAIMKEQNITPRIIFLDGNPQGKVDLVVKATKEELYVCRFLLEPKEIL